jgi:hypothetical protein
MDRKRRRVMGIARGKVSLSTCKSRLGVSLVAPNWYLSHTHTRIHIHTPTHKSENMHHHLHQQQESVESIFSDSLGLLVQDSSEILDDAQLLFGRLNVTVAPKVWLWLNARSQISDLLYVSLSLCRKAGKVQYLCTNQIKISLSGLAPCRSRQLPYWRIISSRLPSSSPSVSNEV